jgi:hypothetical protein
MTRRKETFPELAFHALKNVPWWVGPLFIGATFTLFRWLIPAVIDAPRDYDPSIMEKAVS